ncbi:Gfo/Idh/MocA family oxidoreductase [bacterium]|nr:Gfo/Idh/MocA family oxidoreductase [bacterium]MBU1064759.1 Gfo/Idh/MocA family oxidoreductase [bacterium]MBU1633075.1 Gfo/Idh/MocA family oxidoreductase [bacterium]MBU1872981.1 Gfo/Idh/MocA family oxidoreductase [bacterium]
MKTIALLGCGRISGKHLESIAQLKDDLKLVAVCDILADRAQAAGEKYGVNWYTDYDQMLEREDLDILSICTPSGVHHRHGVAAAKRGLHVIVEKPMAITLEAADQLIQACDKAKVELFVVKQNRLNTTLQMLKRAVDKGRFGKIYIAQSNVFWQRPQSYYDLAKWRGTWEFDGGSFMNQASHYVDAIQWLIGPVEYVMAETATMARQIETEDTGSAILKFRNGVIGTINVTMLTYPKNFEGSITILGEKGTAKVGGVAVNHIDKWEFEDYDDDDRLIEESNYNPPNIYGLGHLPYYKNVIATLKGDSDADTDGRSGRKSLELIIAIYKSAQLGKKIALPLKL